MSLILKTYESDSSPSWFEQVSEHEKREYGDGHFRARKKLLNFAKNFPKGFVVLEDDETGAVMGTTDFYPLKKEAWENLADGLIIEENLPSSAVLIGSPYIYVASVIVAPPSRASFLGTPALFRLLMGKVFSTLSEEKKALSLVGIGSTKKGKILLENLGFSAFEGSVNKIDPRPRFILNDKDGLKIKNLNQKYSISV
jgi:hypothetical protein